MRKALLEAKAIAYSAGGLSGNNFEFAMNKLGILDEVKKKAKNASPAARLVVERRSRYRRSADFRTDRGRRRRAARPAAGELDQVTQFSMGVLSDGKSKEVARALLDFLRTPDAQAVIKAKGLTPG